jgi:hypothetical protein
VDDDAQQRAAEYIRLIFCIEDGKAVPRLVETGISDVTGVQITDGIMPDDLIVTGPYRSLDQLKKGTTVKLEEKSKAKIEEEGEKVADKTEPPAEGTANEATPDEKSDQTGESEDAAVAKSDGDPPRDDESEENR